MGRAYPHRRAVGEPYAVELRATSHGAHPELSQCVTRPPRHRRRARPPNHRLECPLCRTGHYVDHTSPLLVTAPTPLPATLVLPQDKTLSPERHLQRTQAL